jgi:hypothetical protein
MNFKKVFTSGREMALQIFDPSYRDEGFYKVLFLNKYPQV